MGYIFRMMLAPVLAIVLFGCNGDVFIDDIDDDFYIGSVMLSEESASKTVHGPRNPLTEISLASPGVATAYDPVGNQTGEVLKGAGRLKVSDDLVAFSIERYDDGGLRISAYRNFTDNVYTCEIKVNVAGNISTFTLKIDQFSRWSLESLDFDLEKAVITRNVQQRTGTKRIDFNNSEQRDETIAVFINYAEVRFVPDDNPEDLSTIISRIDDADYNVPLIEGDRLTVSSTAIPLQEGILQFNYNLEDAVYETFSIPANSVLELHTLTTYDGFVCPVKGSVMNKKTGKVVCFSGKLTGLQAVDCEYICNFTQKEKFI